MLFPGRRVEEKEREAGHAEYGAAQVGLGGGVVGTIATKLHVSVPIL